MATLNISITTNLLNKTYIENIIVLKCLCYMIDMNIPKYGTLLNKARHSPPLNKKIEAYYI